MSKAELIRRGVALLLDSSDRPKRSGPLPVFDSGRARRAEEMDQAVYEQAREGAQRR